MTYKNYQKDIDTILESEILGKYTFETAAKLSRSKSKRQAWQTLTSLEVQTLDRLYEHLNQHQLQAHSRRFIQLQGYASGIALGILPWPISMRLLRSGTQPFLKAFTRLKENADFNDLDFFDYVLAHEQALYRFADHHLQGKSETALESVHKLLDNDVKSG